ncbi:MAG TPA: hypothetical protein VI383_06395 [Gemmatimonadales bacterium]|nr:hypothetical protein [Gemmatimonadales bacterium]
MIPSPIHKALSTMRRHAVQHLLMGGQACVLYGAAEFSRDADLALLASPENLTRLRTAVGELDATVVAVPPFETQYLDHGHAVHFRCGDGLRIDVMSRMRGVGPFPDLWARRTTLMLPGQTGASLEIDVMSLPDLVSSKKTQRDKDWPMIRRLLESNYFEFRERPTPSRVDFWLRELRTPELLVECVAKFPEEAAGKESGRPALIAAREGDVRAIESELAIEQEAERERDRAYWGPLRAELEQLRRAARTEGLG